VIDEFSMLKSNFKGKTKPASIYMHVMSKYLIEFAHNCGWEVLIYKRKSNSSFIEFS